MKKIVQVGVTSLLILLSITTVSYAGAVPEDLLGDDSSQVYFGEIEDVDGERITVIQRQNIKGEFTKDSKTTYVEFAFTDSPEIGKQYLCGFYDDNNPLYVWEVTSFDTDTLEIKNTDDMSKRMQEYLNDGNFEEAENERLLAIAKAEKSDSVIERTTPVETVNSEGQTQNEAPNETEGSVSISAWILCGVILIMVAVLFWKKRKN